MAYTEFGKALKRLRLDRGELLKDMADKLGCGPAHLSGIEFGKRPVPAGMIARLAGIYGLDKEQAARLEEAREESARKIAADSLQGDMAAAFGAAFKGLSDEQMAARQRFLQGEQDAR